MASQNDLSRFVEAQKNIYFTALSEIKKGEKRTHWMWYIFPQIIGLGSTDISIKYSIKNIEEAFFYLTDPILGYRLREITGELLKVKNKSALEIFGSPDNKKLKSCMTLFSIVSTEDSLFHKVLEKYFDGKKDERTLIILMY